MKRIVFRMMASTVLIAPAALAEPAAAQTAPAAAQTAPAEADTMSDDIIVTAERREQNLQSATISISAISAATLEARGISDVRQLENLSPALRIVEVGQQPSILIRGTGTIVTNVANDPSASFNIDNVPVARPLATTAGLFDIERVEVLKGPQGTLYGRNSTAGAVNVLTKKPTHKAEGQVSLRLGNYDLVQGSLVGNLPISSTLALRAAVQSVRRDGYISNGSEDAHSLAGRLRLLWDPTDDFSLLLTGSWSRLGGIGPGDVPLKNGGDYLDPDHPWFLATNNGTPNGIYQDGLYGNSVPAYGTYQRIRAQNYTAEANWDFGPATLTIIPAYIRTTYKAITYNGGFTQGINATDDQKSIEARLASRPGRFQWIVGAYYLRDDQTAANESHNGPTTRTFNDTPYLDLKTYAIFGQATLGITSRLNLTGGIRYTNDQKETKVSVRPAPLSGIGGTTTTSVGEQSWNYTSYRVGLDYRFSEDNMVYGNISDAYKAGGINRGLATGPAGPAAYTPEHLISYEIGSRNDFFGGKLRLNLEAWYWDYRDIQAQATSCINIPGGVGGGAAACPPNTSSASVTRNVGNATNKGVEAEAVMRLSRSDVINFNVSYIDARYRKAYILPYTLDGQVVPRTPKWSGVISYRHRFFLGNGATLDASATGQFQTRINRILQPIVGQGESGWQTVSAEIGYTSRDKAWTVALWGDNLTNDAHTVYAGQTFAGLWGHPTAPRTYGVRANVGF